ncbi:zinc finger MYM-type protein 1 [Trichonephila clavipes]|nr:zinc finger MYM-type protein 1 [Trichonephila clavipes]
MWIEEWALLQQEMLHQLFLSIPRRCKATIANLLATLRKLNNLACETGNSRVVCINVKSVIEEIIHRVKQAKYYVFLLDCTRDVSRIEQMSIILRFCNSSTGAIEEHFVGFIAFAETTGEYITNSILQKLERNGLDIENCRGQGYDNDANMVGINKGVRTRILNINPRAFFTPCGCHSWNLLLIDAANSSATTKTFFGFINKIYVLFSKSSKRWDTVKIKLKLTLKPLSETRWESRIGAVKAIFLQFDDVIECVNELKNKSDDSETLSECDAVLNEMFSFGFIVAIHVWYEVLLRVNNISKLWQSVQVDLKVAIDTLLSFCSWIQEFRNTGLDCVAQARLSVEKSTFEIESQFKEKRTSRKKRMFGYEHIDEPIKSFEMQYRVNFFNTMFDAIIVDTECRFKALNEQFDFIYDISYLNSISKEDLLKEGRESVEDSKYSGRPQTSHTTENIEKVSAVVHKNRLETIAESVGISSATYQWILTEDLNMHHIVPRMLNEDQSADDVKSALQVE